MGMHIVLVGNPVDGFSFFGPFTTSDEAATWAEAAPLNDDWWVAPLNAQES